MDNTSETRQERRQRYLRLAADAETTGAKQKEPGARKAWADLAKGWRAMAHELLKKD